MFLTILYVSNTVKCILKCLKCLSWYNISHSKMQSEVPKLPVVHLHENASRKHNINSSNTDDNKNYSLCDNTCPIANKKSLHPLLGGSSYKNSIRIYTAAVASKPVNKNTLAQRVMSAKMLRIKQLQNQLADAHYHLNELANENRLLKALQKRQDSALKRYEGTTAELPRIINSHHEELRVLQSKYKKLKALHRDTCDLLKEKEHELQSLQTQNKHLLQLSKDRNLEEREKLKFQVSELNHKIQQQQETIQILQRKLTLESKSLKHQLHVEISKHKETQKHLQQVLEQLKGVEHLLSNRTRKQLLINNKDKVFESQSLINLRELSVPLATSKECKKYPQKDNLPVIGTSEPQNDNKTDQTSKNMNGQQTNMSNLELTLDLRQSQKIKPQKTICKNSLMQERIKISTIAEQKEELDEVTQTVINNSDFGPVVQKNVHDSYTKIEKSDETFKYALEDTLYKLPEQSEIENCSSYNGDETNEYQNTDRQLRNAVKNSQELCARMIANEESNSTSYAAEIQKDQTNSSEEKEKSGGKSSNQRDENNQNIKRSISVKDGFSVEYENDRFGKTLSDSYSEEFSKSNTKLLGTNLQHFGQKIQMDNMKYQHEGMHAKSEQITSTIKNKDDKTDDSMSSIAAWTDDEFYVSVQSEYKQNSFIDNTYQNYSTLATRLNNSNPFEDKLTSTKSRSQVSLDESENQIETNKFGNNDVSKLKLNENMQRLEIDENYSSYNKNNYYTIDYIESSMENKSEINEEQSSDKALVNYDKNGDSKELTVPKVEKRKKFETQYTFHVPGKRPNENNQGDTTPNMNVINYNKEKLLATMKAIDNNDNMDYSMEQHFSKNNNSIDQFEKTKNLFRGLPAHNSRKHEVIRTVYGNGSVDSKVGFT